MSETNGNRPVILKRAKDYYENNKETVSKNRYRNMSDEKKQELKEYQRNYREARRAR